MKSQKQKHSKWGKKTLYILQELKEKYGINVSCFAEAVA